MTKTKLIDTLQRNPDLLDENHLDETYAEDFIEDLAITANENVQAVYGASKMVVFIQDEDGNDENEVVKIPFHYYYGNPFEYGDGENCDDYIRHEQTIYEDAKDWGLEQFFAPNKKIAQIGCTSIYTQEKCYEIYSTKGTEFFPKDCTKEERVLANSIGEDRLNIEWWISVIRNYGVKLASLLSEYIDANITDLHFENFGFSQDGKPIIFDYAGFDEESY